MNSGQGAWGNNAHTAAAVITSGNNGPQQPVAPAPITTVSNQNVTSTVGSGPSPDENTNGDGFSAPPYASASLYIGDLHPDVTEPVLYEVFSQPASVASIRICRDSQTQRSLGYGYVNYHTIPDAERAMDVLNFTQVKGRPCRIMWANRDKSARTKSENNVFVKNLDRNIDNKALYDTFSLFGHIVSCKVVTDSSGKSLGYGYVQYEKEQSLIDAIKRVNGMQIGNSTVYCGRHKRKEERASLRDEKFTNLYVKGYDPTVVSAEKIKNLFVDIGEVTSSMTKVDEKGRESIFINYNSFESAKEAVTKYDGLRFDSNGELLSREETKALDDAEQVEKEPVPFEESSVYRLYVTRHQSRAERDEKLKQAFAPKVQPVEPQSTVLYTRHFPVFYTDEDLKALFEPFGIVTSARVARDEHGNSRGFGFVTLPDAQDAQKAITGLHETTIGSENGPLSAKLYVAYLEPKDTRQTRLKAQIAENMWRPNQYQGYRAAATTVPTNGTRYPSVIPAGHRMAFPVRNQNPRGRQPGRSTNRTGMSFPETPGIPMDAPLMSDNITTLGFKEQKQAIGDSLYHVIMVRQPALAGKITGMMLEMPNEELLKLLQRPDELSVKIDEAIEVLKAAGSSQMKQ